ncbi:transporter substrate-binding domain-containing protein [Desulfobacterales bacterium HSG17]|nr:transporter substrate-binding domain-containing protein [Desulfobacterales bacterium HSG17]
MKHIVFIILSILAAVQPVQAGEKLVFSGLQNSKLGLMVEEVLQKAYKHIGIEAKIKWLPGARALQMANNGEVDGAQLRVASIKKKYTNLIMIPIPVYETEIVVFTRNMDFPVKGWDSLKPYKMGVPGGYTAILDNVRDFNCWTVNYVQIFKMLDTNRVDIGILDRFNGLITIKKLGIKDIKILNPPLSNIQFYNFLHKKHKDIVPEITAVLQDMRDKGKISEIWEKFESKFTKE